MCPGHPHTPALRPVLAPRLPSPSQPDSPAPPAPTSGLRLPRGSLAALMVVLHLGPPPSPTGTHPRSQSSSGGGSRPHCRPVSLPQAPLHTHPDAVSAASPSFPGSRVSSVFLSSLMFHHSLPTPHTRPPAHRHAPRPAPLPGAPLPVAMSVGVRLGSLTSPERGGRPASSDGGGVMGDGSSPDTLPSYRCVA